VTTDTPRGPTARDIDFHETPEQTLSLDVYQSVDGGPRPTIVLLYGGAFHSGEKTQLAAQATALADAGYTVVTPEYRLSGDATFPAALIDAKAAVEWCRAEGEAYGIDPQRIATVGHSAGANLAVLVAVTADEPGFEPESYPGISSAVQATVGWAGLYDFRSFDEDPQIHVDYLGGTRETVPTAYDFASPMGQTDAHTPPTLVVHGDADETLPIEQARRYADAVDTLATGEFVLFDDAAHQFPHDRFERTIEETDRFLSVHLVAGTGGRQDRDAGGDPTAFDRDAPRESPGGDRIDR